MVRLHPVLPALIMVRGRWWSLPIGEAPPSQLIKMLTAIHLLARSCPGVGLVRKAALGRRGRRSGAWLLHGDVDCGT